MAVSGVSGGSSTSSLYGNRNVISGLASGIDTESLIENMVAGTRTKINNKLKEQQTLLWKQEAYQSITDKLVALSTKYTSYTSSTNLYSSSFFKPSIVTPTGEYAKYLSASGTMNGDVQVLGVSQLAEKATYAVSGNELMAPGSSTITSTNAVDLLGQADISNIAGQGLTFEYGNKTATIYLSSNKEYNSAQDIADEINAQLANAKVSATDGTSINLGEKITAKADGDKLTFSVGDKESNKVAISEYSSSKLMGALGLSGGETINKGTGLSMDVPESKLTSKQSVSSVLAGSTMRFSYNGKTVNIEMPTKDSDEYKEIFQAKDSSTASAAMTDYLQQQLDNAFGFDRIKVENQSTDGKFQPTFSLQDGDSSSFSIDSGTLNVVGKSGIFGIEAGAGNRVNTSKTLEDILGTDEAGSLKGMKAVGKDDKENDLYSFEINGVKIGEFTKDTKISTLMDAVNKNKDVGLRMSYSSTANQFVFAATHGGAGGKVEIQSQPETTGEENNLAAKLFGATVDKDGNKLTTTTGTYTEGKDAKMKVSINGAITDLTSDNNTFDIDGFKVTASGTFPTGEDGKVITEQAQLTKPVSFSSSVDADKIVDAVKSFVKDYNEMIDALHTQLDTKHDRKYTALTDDEKADLSDKQIETLEAKAKEGLLFNDVDLRSLSDSLRFVFSNSAMSNIGITTSTSYKDNGKIELDESKLRAALSSDPDSVKNAFVSANDTDTKYESTSITSGGVMNRLKTVLDKYAQTTGANKGILINKAGSQYSPLSLLNNNIQKQLESIDDTLDTLYDKLDDQIDRYTQKWSKFEVLINQMNSQSSYLAGMMGGTA